VEQRDPRNLDGKNLLDRKIMGDGLATHSPLERNLCDGLGHAHLANRHVGVHDERVTAKEHFFVIKSA